jgi:hypothetical protein
MWDVWITPSDLWKKNKKAPTNLWSVGALSFTSFSRQDLASKFPSSPNSKSYKTHAKKQQGARFGDAGGSAVNIYVRDVVP